MNKQRFTTKLRWDVISARKRLISEDFFYIDIYGYTWRAPKGMIVNGASTPRLLWRISPPFADAHVWASALHDAYYQSPRGRTRYDIDKMYREVSIFCGVPKWRANIEYLAVRAYGKGNFNDNKN